MIATPFSGKVYLAVGSTDMCKAINGLSIMVEQILSPGICLYFAIACARSSRFCTGITTGSACGTNGLKNIGSNDRKQVMISS